MIGNFINSFVQVVRNAWEKIKSAAKWAEDHKEEIVAVIDKVKTVYEIVKQGIIILKQVIRILVQIYARSPG